MASEQRHDRRRSLRPRLQVTLLTYFVLVHLLIAGAAVYLVRDQPIWLLVIEGAFVLSLVVGWRLVRALFVPLELIGAGADMIEDEEFTIHFRRVNQPELDRLLQVYNTMVDRLKDERIRTEEQNELLDRVINASPGGVVVCDLEGRISMLNPAAHSILGGDADALLGTDPAEHPILSQVADTEIGRSAVVTARGARRIRCTRTEFRDRGFLRTLFLVEELTKELRASEKEAYGQLIRLISHEVNNSVGPVSSLVETVRTYGSRLGEADRRRFESGLDLAAQRLHHLRDFVDGFADVVKLPDPQRAACDLDRVLEDVVQVLQPTLQERGLEVRWERRDPLGSIVVDKNQLEQVLINVIGNAAEASRTGTAITLRTLHDDGRPVLEVEDSGDGIAPEVEERLFQPFFSTKDQGRGLGLTLVNEILTRHGFAFSLENAPTGGALFRIELTPAEGSVPLSRTRGRMRTHPGVPHDRTS